MDGVLKTVHVGVLRFDEDVLVDAAAQTEDVRYVVLLLLQRFLHDVEGALAVAFAVPPVQSEGV